MKAVIREVLLAGVLAILIAGGVYVFRANAGLKKQNEELRAQAGQPIVGQYVPQTHARTVQGDTVIVGREGERQLLVFFNERCPYCRASTAAWRLIADSLANDPIRIYGIAFDSAEAAAAYRDIHSLAFPVIPITSRRFVDVYKISSVPMVMVVQNDGTIGYARRGTLAAPASVDSVIAAAREEL